MNPALIKADGLHERLKYELKETQAGHHIIAGLDEAGRGPLAGPVVAAAVVLPEDPTGLEEINDSKKCTAKKRQELYILIHERARSIGVGIVDAPTIDKVNILQATFLAMQKAVHAMTSQPDFLLIDGNQRPPWMDQGTMIVKGEQHSLSIAAASIIAKVTRDRVMVDYDHHYPDWGFAKHKGYGTADHLEAINHKGICDIHRRSFAPISKIISSN